jgi:hypothetical protein
MKTRSLVAVGLLMFGAASASAQVTNSETLGTFEAQARQAERLQDSTSIKDLGSRPRYNRSFYGPYYTYDYYGPMYGGYATYQPYHHLNHYPPVTGSLPLNTPGYIMSGDLPYPGPNTFPRNSRWGF